MRVLALLLLLCMAACTVDVETLVDAGSVPQTLPVLEPVSVPSLNHLGKSSMLRTFAVSNHGHVAYTMRADSGMDLVVVDSTGAVLSTTSGRVGSYGFMQFTTNDLLIVMDVDSRTWFGLTPDGRIEFSSPATIAGIPSWISRDSADVYDVESIANSAGRVGFTSLQRVSLRSGEARLIVDGGNALVQQVAAPQGASMMHPVFATSQDRVVLANPYTFSFEVLAPDGAELYSWSVDMPRLMLTEAEIEAMVEAASPRLKEDARRRATAPQRHFSAIKFDGRGRLWTIRTGLPATSQPAHVFADSVHLGEIPLPCDTPVVDAAFSADWMAISCRHSVQDSVSIQLFRIRG